MQEVLDKWVLELLAGIVDHDLAMPVWELLVLGLNGFVCASHSQCHTSMVSQMGSFMLQA